MQHERPDSVSHHEAENNEEMAPHRLDEMVARGSQAVARMSLGRRHMLGRVGKLLLALTGVSLIEALPIDREVPVAEATSGDCNAWYMCNIAADRVCSCACGSNNCPSGTQAGSYWTGCCNNGVYIRVQYWDCCKTTGNSCCSKSGCGCQHPAGHTEPPWCGGVSGGLCCTMIATAGFC